MITGTRWQSHLPRVRNTIGRRSLPRLQLRWFSQAVAKQKKPRTKVKEAGANAHETGEIVCSLVDVTKALPGGRVLFQDVRLSFVKGAKIGVLGVNGSGKSSLLKVLSGDDREYYGEVWRKPGMKIKYLSQEAELDTSLDVQGNVRLGIQEQESLLTRFDDVANEMSNPDADFDKLLEEQSALQAKIEDLDCWNLQHRVSTAMQALHLPPPDAPMMSLSGGEQRRVALCRMLLEQPDMLLLDEPTNHLDADSVAWLEAFLKSYKGTVIAVTHDRYFLDKIAGWILEVDRGALYPFRGNYTSWLEQKHRRLSMEKAKEAAQARAVQSELDWIRQRSSQASKARVHGAEKRKLEQQEASARVHQLETGRIVIPPGPRLGDRVLRASGISKSFDGRVLFKNLSFELTPGAIVGIVGANGCGKTTLFNVLSGLKPPDTGTIELGPTVKIGLVSQLRTDLNDNNTVYKEISQTEDFISLGDKTVNTRAYIAAFNLKGTMQEKRVGDLSGGERSRVHLAKVLKSRNNVLLLDEPTNHLDVETLRALEDALREFPGCAVIISHDRWFLDRICTHTMAFGEDGHVEVFPGTYTDLKRYQEQERGR